MKHPLKYWNHETFDVTDYKWKLHERKNKILKTNGSDNSKKNTYTFNELGFRGDKLPLFGKKVMTVGCSHTEGIGVSDNETWPYYISKKINYSHINFGYTGRSNDYISRVILSFVDYIKPDLVLIMYTYPERREYYTSKNGIEPFHSNPWGWFENNKKEFNSFISLLNDNENFINWYKNHLLISNFLKNKNIPYLWNGTFLNTDYTDEFRFDGDYIIEYGQHASPIQNKNYSEKLYSKILEKSYL